MTEQIKILKLDSASKEDLVKVFTRASTDINEVSKDVEKIIEDVRKNGDEALIRYTKQFDDSVFSLERLKVTNQDFETAYSKIAPSTLEMIKKQVRLSKAFHAEQRKRIIDWKEELSSGITVGEKWTPIDAVGLYVPGGKNPFPTVQQILAVPAITAGCKKIVSCISPKGDGYEVLVAAKEAGITELYRVGGAQAIAAMAYGTETIPKVELIAGPGSPYVTAAKMLCQKVIAIDMPAGPSEAIIFADDSLSDGITLQKKAQWCAADILARAEHGADSAGVLVTNSLELAEKTKAEIEIQFQTLSRKDYIRKALKGYSAIIVCKDISEGIQYINQYAPEHLELMVQDPEKILSEITNSGSVFLGNYNPVATGDYAIGLNHILPTGGWARRTSAVGVWTFMKRVQFSEVTKLGLTELKPIVDTIADVEGLDAHRRSVDMRFE